MTGACPAHDKSVSSGLDNLLFCLVFFSCFSLPEPLLAAAGFRIGNEKRKSARSEQSAGESEIESGTC